MDGVAEVGVCPRIWKAYNESALANEPVLDFPKPEGLARVKICLSSGKLVNTFCPAKEQQWATFWKNDVPREHCEVHSSKAMNKFMEKAEKDLNEEAH
jgi:membrane carboxypeptidase/penicillin-binding protein